MTMPPAFVSCLAGLLHDMGKVGDRSSGLQLNTQNQNAIGTYCPSDGKGGYTHRHAIWTVQFFDQLLGNDLGEWAQVMVASGRHHVEPANATEQAVQDADRLSAGIDRGAKKVEDRSKWTKYLSPSFDELKDETSAQKRYFEPIASDTFSNLEGLITKAGNVAAPHADKYRKIWDGMIKDARRIWSYFHDKKINISQLMMLTDQISEKWLARIPANTNSSDPNVSLYDHHRSTAAIAALLVESLSDKGYDNFAVLRIDIDGIQSFISRIAIDKGAAKILRGRSVCVEILPTMIACELAYSLNLPQPMVVSAVSGHLTMLIPGSRLIDAKRVVKKIHEDILEKYDAQLDVSYAFLEDLPIDSLKNWSDLMTRVSASTAKMKRLKLKFINPDLYQHTFSGELCKYCEYSQVADSNSDICEQCNEFRVIGSDHRARYRVIRRITARPGIKNLVIEAPKFRSIDEMSIKDWSQIEFMMNVRPHDGDSLLPRSKALYTIPLDEETDRVLEFDEIAPSKIAALKLDVDKLGIFMRDKAQSLGRYLSISRQIEWFFKGIAQDRIYASPLRNSIYSIYIGGDDILLVGDHQAVTILAQQINREFAGWTGERLKISGAVKLAKSGSPVRRLARLAGDDASDAKRAGGDRLQILDRILEWQQFDRARSICEQVLASIDNQSGATSGDIYRLLQHFASADNIRNAGEKPMRPDDLLFLSRLHYDINRDKTGRIKKFVEKDLGIPLSNDFMTIVEAFADAQCEVGLKLAIYRQRDERNFND